MDKPGAHPPARLPASWQLAPHRHATELAGHLLPDLRRWVALADAPAALLAPDTLFEWLERHYPQGWLIRGAHPPLLKAARRHGLHYLVSGQEALLQPDQPPRKSLRELARRGRRWGEIVAYTPQLAQTWQRLQPPPGNRLQHLFRQRPERARHAWLLLTPEERPLGAISLSAGGPACLHLEEMNRKADAPVGIMEALLLHALKAARQNGYQWLSLGEVPFTGPAFGPRMKLLYRTGNSGQKSFNPNGLRSFKAKFHPHWQPIGWVSNRPIGLGTLGSLFFQTNAAQLWLRGWLGL